MKAYGFPKSEHLTLKRHIDALFTEGNRSAVAFPIRAVWREVEWDGHSPRVKVLVSVSKRKFKHAVDRNRAKRQMREAYRLNKHILAHNLTESQTENQAGTTALHIGFIWLADKPQKSSKVQKRIVTLLKNINEACSKP